MEFVNFYDGISSATKKTSDKSVKQEFLDCDFLIDCNNARKIRDVLQFIINDIPQIKTYLTNFDNYEKKIFETINKLNNNLNIFDFINKYSTPVIKSFYNGDTFPQIYSHVNSFTNSPKVDLDKETSDKINLILNMKHYNNVFKVRHISIEEKKDIEVKKDIEEKKDIGQKRNLEYNINDIFNLITFENYELVIKYLLNSDIITNTADKDEILNSIIFRYIINYINTKKDINISNTYLHNSKIKILLLLLNQIIRQLTYTSLILNMNIDIHLIRTDIKKKILELIEEYKKNKESITDHETLIQKRNELYSEIYQKTQITSFDIIQKTFTYKIDTQINSQLFSKLCIIDSIDSYTLNYSMRCLDPTNKESVFLTGGSRHKKIQGGNNNNINSSISTSSLC